MNEPDDVSSGEVGVVETTAPPEVDDGFLAIAVRTPDASSAIASCRRKAEMHVESIDVDDDANACSGVAAAIDLLGDPPFEARVIAVT